MNQRLTIPPALKREEATAVNLQRGRRLAVESRLVERAPQKAQALSWRNVRMLLEVGWLTAALTLQLYVPDAKGFWIVCFLPKQRP